MAEVQSTADPFSLKNRIERSEQRIARQREIVEALIKYNVAGPAQRLLALMEEALAQLREEEQMEQAVPAPAAPEPKSDESAPQPEMVTTE